jgi:Sec-independent protein translocase protein TatA
MAVEPALDKVRASSVTWLVLASIMVAATLGANARAMYGTIDSIREQMRANNDEFREFRAEQQRVNAEQSRTNAELQKQLAVLDATMRDVRDALKR